MALLREIGQRGEQCGLAMAALEAAIGDAEFAAAIKDRLLAQGNGTLDATGWTRGQLAQLARAAAQVDAVVRAWRLGDGVHAIRLQLGAAELAAEEADRGGIATLFNAFEHAHTLEAVAGELPPPDGASLDCRGCLRLHWIVPASALSSMSFITASGVSVRGGGQPQGVAGPAAAGDEAHGTHAHPAPSPSPSDAFRLAVNAGDVAAARHALVEARGEAEADTHKMAFRMGLVDAMRRDDAAMVGMFMELVALAGPGYRTWLPLGQSAEILFTQGKCSFGGGVGEALTRGCEAAAVAFAQGIGAARAKWHLYEGGSKIGDGPLNPYELGGGDAMERDGATLIHALCRDGAEVAAPLAAARLRTLAAYTGEVAKYASERELYALCVARVGDRSAQAVALANGNPCAAAALDIALLRHAAPDVACRLLARTEVSLPTLLNALDRLDAQQSPEAAPQRAALVAAWGDMAVRLLSMEGKAGAKGPQLLRAAGAGVDQIAQLLREQGSEESLACLDRLRSGVCAALGKMLRQQPDARRCLQALRDAQLRPDRWLAPSGRVERDGNVEHVDHARPAEHVDHIGPAASLANLASAALREKVTPTALRAAGVHVTQLIALLSQADQPQAAVALQNLLHAAGAIVREALGGKGSMETKMAMLSRDGIDAHRLLLELRALESPTQACASLRDQFNAVFPQVEAARALMLLAGPAPVLHKVQALQDAGIDVHQVVLDLQKTPGDASNRLIDRLVLFHARLAEALARLEVLGLAGGDEKRLRTLIEKSRRSDVLRATVPDILRLLHGEPATPASAAHRADDEKDDSTHESRAACNAHPPASAAHDGSSLWIETPAEPQFIFALVKGAVISRRVAQFASKLGDGEQIIVPGDSAYPHVLFNATQVQLRDASGKVTDLMHASGWANLAAINAQLRQNKLDRSFRACLELLKAAVHNGFQGPD